MATNVDLDALIRRADFDEGDQAPRRSGGGSIKVQVEVRDLKKNEFFFSALRKPDFQRETDDWDVNRIVDLIKCFVSKDVIPAVIIWESNSGLLYIIDGAHRLSALAAWVNDDYGAGEISKLFYEGIIPDEQVEIANHVKTAVNKVVGSYADHELAREHPDKVKPHVITQATALSNAAIPIQYVIGTSAKAEDSFKKINEQGASLNPTERKILAGRKTPRCIAARAIIKAGKGYNYWAGFDAMVQITLQNSAKEIHDLLFLPKLKNPIKTLDLPMAGKMYSNNKLNLVWDFISIVNPPTEKEEADKDGELTLRFLTNCRKVAQRINSVHLSSLGLHPVVYLYSQSGRFKPASFYAIADLVMTLDNDGGFVRFCKVRENFESLLIANDYIIQQIVRNDRGAFASYKNIAKFYLTCINELSSGKSINTVIEDIHKMDDFKFLTKPVDSPKSTVIGDFSSETKSATFIKAALAGAPKCGLCHGYIHTNSITTGHIKDQIDGGTRSEENAQLEHPYCNSTLKKTVAAETKPLGA
jgi:hypothetical protein